MRDLLLPCTKNVHFSCSGDTSLLAGIFMVELERTEFPTLREHMSPWKRYLDNTISRIKEESIENVLSKLKGNIKLTYEIQNNGTLPFLDVLEIRKDHKVQTTVYRKSTNNDMYFH